MARFWLLFFPISVSLKSVMVAHLMCDASVTADYCICVVYAAVFINGGEMTQSFSYVQ